MKNVFLSRSAKATKESIIPIVRKVITCDSSTLVVWMGNDRRKLFESCFNVTTKKIDKSTDMSGIIKARFLVLCYVDLLLPYAVNLISFACEYGIPIIWIGPPASPKKRNWNLSMQLDDPSFFTFWEQTWPLVK